MSSFLPIVISVLLTALSLYAFSSALAAYLVRRRGIPASAVIDKVEHVIPYGLKRSLSGKDRTIGCDYIMKLSFTDDRKRMIWTRITLRGRIRILKGRMIPFFAPGMNVKIRYSKHLRKIVFIDEDVVRERQGRVFMVVIWGISLILLIAITLFLLLY